MNINVVVKFEKPKFQDERFKCEKYRNHSFYFLEFLTIGRKFKCDLDSLYIFRRNFYLWIRTFHALLWLSDKIVIRNWWCMALAYSHVIKRVSVGDLIPGRSAPPDQNTISHNQF